MSIHKIRGSSLLVLFKYLTGTKIKTDDKKFDASFANEADVDIHTPIIPLVFEPRFRAVYERKDNTGKNQKLIINGDGCYLIVSS